MRAIRRALVDRIRARLERPPALLQVIVGPRQAGKTTAARQIGDAWDGPVHYAAADLPGAPGPEWVGALFAIEVKSGRPSRPAGMAAFLRAHPRARPLVVGSGGMPLEEFFSTDPAEILV